MTPQELAQSMADHPEHIVLLDVRMPMEREMARLEPSLFVPLYELPTRLTELRPWQEKLLVVYCHHGVRSRYAMDFLRQQGFAQVDHLDGGIDLWSQDIDPSIPRYG